LLDEEKLLHFLGKKKIRRSQIFKQLSNEPGNVARFVRNTPSYPMSTRGSNALSITPCVVRSGA
jgi:hypothetical protein